MNWDKAEKWLPEVGQKCELRAVNKSTIFTLNEADWVAGGISYISDGGVVFNHRGLDLFFSAVTHKYEFRPIQSEVNNHIEEMEEQKHRIKIVFELLGLTASEKALNISYNHGLRVLGPDERIIKR